VVVVVVVVVFDFGFVLWRDNQTKPNNKKPNKLATTERQFGERDSVVYHKE
jgi:hypothetical protein